MSAHLAPAATTPDATPARRPRRFWLRLLMVLVVAAAAAGILAWSGLRGTLVYYETPSELAAKPSLHGRRVRLGGLVAPGSVRHTRTGVTFTLTDGVTDVRVAYRGTPGGVFAPGQNALVDGVWRHNDTFRGDEIMVKHSNDYRGRDGRPYTPPPMRDGRR